MVEKGGEGRRRVEKGGRGGERWEEVGRGGERWGEVAKRKGRTRFASSLNLDLEDDGEPSGNELCSIQISER